MSTASWSMLPPRWTMSSGSGPLGSPSSTGDSRQSSGCTLDSRHSSCSIDHYVRRTCTYPAGGAVSKGSDGMSQREVIIGIGGAAGDGVASAGNTLAVSVARQGQAVFAYNSYQSVIRGGHSWLRLRISTKKPLNHGDQVDAIIALNQDTLDRHLKELRAGGLALYNAAKLKPRYEPPKGVQLCPLPVPELTPAYSQLPIMQNTVAVGAAIRLTGLDFAGLESVLQSTFAKKPQVVEMNVQAAKAGYDYA